MKYKNIYSLIIFILGTLIAGWVIPSFVKKATASRQNYPFVYYSSILQDFAIRNFDNNEMEHIDRKGNVYTREEYDSITPLLSYRQLSLEGKMPDSILGVEMEPRMLRVKTVMWRYSPRDISRPTLDMHLMYESMSGRASLESPPDVFRVKDKIEFIDKGTNSVNEEKSQLFQQKMEEKGFAFPAQKAWGNPSPRKPYDEGYFVLDSKGELFHIKLVNKRPYVGNTHVGKNINIAYFSLYEIPDKSIYGFIVSQEGSIYTLNAQGGYETTKFDIPPIDIHTHSVMMLGNIFYWMVNITSPEGTSYHVLDLNKKLIEHDTPYFVASKEDNWDKLSRWLFPIYINFENQTTEYIVPEVIYNGGWSYLVSVLWIGLYLASSRKGRRKNIKIINFIVIFLVGLPAYIVSLITK